MRAHFLPKKSDKEQALPHPYQPRRLGSPCPGISILVNHGYLPVTSPDDRIQLRDLINALVEGFNLSWFHATFLSILGVLLCGEGLSVSIRELGKHGRIEHDGSITRYDQAFGDALNPNENLINEFIDPKANPHQISLSDYAIRRSELQAFAPKPFSLKTRLTALGEVGLTIAIFGEKQQAVHSKALYTVFSEEQLPQGWLKPQKKVRIRDILKIGWKLNQHIKYFDQENKAGKTHIISSF